MRVEKNGGLIVQCGQEQRYLLVGSRLTGNEDLAHHIDEQIAAAYDFSYKRARRHLKSGAGLPPQLLKLDEEGLPVGMKRATGLLLPLLIRLNAEADLVRQGVPLDPNFTEPALEGLRATAGLSKLGAIRHRIVRPAARQMIEDAQLRILWING